MRRSTLIAATGLVGCLVEFPLPTEGGGSTAGDTGDTDDTDDTVATTGPITSTESSDTASTDTDVIPESGKWVRVAAIAGSSVSDHIPDTAETARFDLLVTSPDHATLWTGPAGDSWSNLRALNPDIRLFVSVQNAADYATDEGFGDGWDWIAENHGIGSADRWTAVGVNNPSSYLQWSSHYAMTIAPATWRAYQLESMRAGLAEALGPDALAQIDGIYIQTSFGYQYPRENEWEVEVSPGVFETDYAADYHDGMAYDHERYATDLDLYLDEAIELFTSADPPLEIALGFTGLHNEEQWERLDTRARPVAFAYSNAGLVQQWGTGTYNVSHFQTRLRVIGNLQNMGLLHGNQGAAADIEVEGLAKMDAPALTSPGEGTTQTTGWEALWFALCGHMATIDPARDDQWFYFSVWDIREFHWFDEYDPEVLHLGEPLGAAFELDGATMREFEDGWVAVNGTQADLLGVQVPSGSARVITHDELSSPERAALVTAFDLPLHRGVILLRDGATLGR